MARLLIRVFADTDYASKATDRKSVPGRVTAWGGACVQRFSLARQCVA